MRTWSETRLSSFPFPIIAGSTCVAVSAECRRLMRDAIKACLVGFKEKDATSWEAKSYGREKRCLWSLSKWGAFARLGSGGENEWEASYEADRHTCRWIIWQQGQMLHHCWVHVQPSHPPRSKSVDAVQLHIRLMNLCWWESCNTSVVCLKVVWRRMSVTPPREWLMQLWHSTRHQSGCKLAPRTPGCAATDGRRRWNDPMHLSDALMGMKRVAVRALLNRETVQLQH